MSTTDLTNTINELSANWEQFKVVNDRRISEIEKKGSADPLTLQHIHNLNSKLDAQGNTIAQLKLMMQRPEGNANGAEYANAVPNKEYKNAFCQYIRKGQNMDALSQLEKKSLSAIHLADSESGYLITSQMAEQIHADLNALSPMRQLSNNAEIATDALELLDNSVENMAGWTAEVNNYNDTSKVKVDKKIIPVHELFAQPMVTQKLLDDPRIDIEKWLAEKLTEVFLAKENQAFINGDGAGKPYGILANTQSTTNNKNNTEVIAVSTKDRFSADDIIKLFYSLKEKYVLGAKFLLSRSALQMIRMLKDSNNRYLWQPRLEEKSADLLLGAEVVLSSDMPAVAAGSMPIIYGNFKRGYCVVDRHSIRILRDPYTEKPFVKFYSTKKLGGGIIDFDALKILKLAN